MGFCNRWSWTGILFSSILNGFFIEIVFQVNICFSSSLCISKKIYNIYNLFVSVFKQIINQINPCFFPKFDWKQKNTAAYGKYADVAMFTASKLHQICHEMNQTYQELNIWFNILSNKNNSCVQCTLNSIRHPFPPTRLPLWQNKYNQYNGIKANWKWRQFGKFI